MGIIKNAIDVIPFTLNHVRDKTLLIKILNAEETLWKSDFGQNAHRNKFNWGLEDQKSIQRENLFNHGFTNDDESLAVYRRIIDTYYNSPWDYDKDIMNSVHYFRENRLLYYKTKEIIKGDNIRMDCETPMLFSRCGNYISTISEELCKVDKNWKHGIIHSFSRS